MKRVILRCGVDVLQLNQTLCGDEMSIEDGISSTEGQSAVHGILFFVDRPIS